MIEISEQRLDEFIAILAKEGTTFENREVARKCATDMLEFYQALAEEPTISLDTSAEAS